MNIAILAIGNEVLCGKIIDTNGAAISREIERLGAKVVHREVVMDAIDDIILGLQHAYEYADFVITIGGLGPTIDDLTREGVAQFFDEPLIYDHAIFEGIERHFSRMNRVAPENNKKQAYKFATGEILENSKGTAPGLSLEKDGRQIFLLPGPPDEIFPMFENTVKPVIKLMIDEAMMTYSYKLYGIGESPAEDKIFHLYDSYPMLNIAPYCTISSVDYLVTAKVTHKEMLDQFEKEFLGILGEYWVGTAEDALNVTVVKQLKKLKLKIAIAESCTGGMLASTFIDVPGVSEVFLEGLVTYSNEAKVARLGVNEETIACHGAVSEACAREMAVRLQVITGADVAISVTGIAGPTGGTDAKPVGLVFIGIAIGEDVHIHKCFFSGDREKIRIRCRDQALHLLYQSLKTQVGV